MSMNIPPSRTVVGLKRKPSSFLPPPHKKRPCRARPSRGQRPSTQLNPAFLNPPSSSEQELAATFIELIQDHNVSEIRDMGIRICAMKRFGSGFSERVFVEALLSSIQQRPPLDIDWTLIGYWHLTRAAPVYIHLDALIEAAPPDWIESQYRHVLHTPDTAIVQGYLEVLLAEKGRRPLIQALLRTDEDKVSEHVLEILQDTTRLKGLSRDVRRSLALELILECKVRASQPKPILRAKRALFAGERPPYPPSLFRWFGEHTPGWPHLSTLILTHAVSGKPNLSYLLGLYDASCQALSSLAIIEIMDTLNTRIQTELEFGEMRTDMLALILSLAQIAFHRLDQVAQYALWFKEKFITKATRCLPTERAMQGFIHSLTEMIPQEAGSILQIHGKMLINAGDEGREYAQKVKMRLMDLGLDHTLHSLPTDMTRPVSLKATKTVERMETTADTEKVIRLFVHANYSIPSSLLEDCIFLPRWFRSVFVPAMTDYDGDMRSDRDRLMAALHEKKKLSDKMYSEFLANKK